MTQDKPIDSFSEENFFLSNLYPSPMVVDGKFYQTVEHAFHACKAKNDEDAKLVRECESAIQAKRLGRQMPVRDDWEEVQIAVMRRLLLVKFCSNRQLVKKLLDTGDRKIVYSNNDGDWYWGQYEGNGHNNIGILLMEVRSILRAEVAQPGRAPTL